MSENEKRDDEKRDATLNETGPTWTVPIGDSENSNSDSARPSKQRQIGPYHLLRPLGEGGMGTVYLVEQRQPVHRRAALKIIKAGMDTGQVIARFEAERQALAMMDHPNIAKVLDAGATETGQPYFVMELVEGQPIIEFSDRNKLSIPERLELFVTVCQAVQHAHQKGIIHRDLKPSNILVTQKDDKSMAKVIDFGLAKAMNHQLTEKTLFTAQGQVLGTPAYMSPEQTGSNDLDIDTRSDIYSLGVILYELLTGSTPLKRESLRGANLVEILKRIQEEEPERPSSRISDSEESLATISSERQVEPRRFSLLMKGDLDLIVLKAMDKDRERRYETANDLAGDIHHYLNNEPIEARPPSAMYLLEKFTRKHRGAVISICAFAMLLVVASVVSGTLAIKALRAGALANRRFAGEKEAREEAETQQALAEQARQESHRSLIGLRIATGRNHADAAQYPESLLWYAKAWADDTERSRNPASHRLRIASAMAQMPKLTGLCIHEHDLRGAVFHPDEQRLLVFDTSSVFRLWDPESATEVATYDHQSNLRPTYARFGAHGKLLATCADNTVKLWDVESQKLIHSLVHPLRVVTAEFHPDNARLVTSCEDSMARIWSVETGELIDDTLRCEGKVRLAQFTPKGDCVIAVDHRSKGTAFRLGDRKVIASNLDMDAIWSARRPETGRQLKFVDQGRIAIGFGDRHLRFWDTETWEQVHSIAMERCFEFAATPKGDRIAATTTSSNAILLHLNDDFREVNRFLIPNPRQTYRVDISDDGEFVAINSTGGTIHVFQGTDGQLVTALPPSMPLYALEFQSTTDGVVRLLTASDDGVARIRRFGDMDASLQECELASCGIANRVGWIKRGEFKVACSADGELEFRVEGTGGRIHNVRSGKPQGILVEHQQEILHAVFSNDRRRLVTCDATTAVVRDAATGRRNGAEVACSAPVRSLNVSDNGDRVFFLLQDNRVIVWDSDTGKILLGEEHPPKKDVANSISNTFPATAKNGSANLSPDGQTVVVGDPKNHVHVAYSVENGREIVQTDRQLGVAAPLQFSANSQRFIVANSDTRARVWDLAEGAAGPIFRHGTFVRRACLSPDGRRAATYAADGVLRLWDSDRGDLLAAIPLDLAGASIWYSHDGSRIIVKKVDQLYELSLPSFEGDVETTQALVELLCSAWIDETDGISPLDRDHFQRNMNRFINAFQGGLDESEFK